MCVSRRISIVTLLVLALSGLIPNAAAQVAERRAEDGIARDAKPYRLMVGDAAPPLAIERWIKGRPEERFENGRIYVLEFWATWCGPCVAGMPHLSELQRRHAKDGVTVIGVSTRDDYGNSLEAVQALVAKKADQAAYTFAWDDQTGTDHAYQGVFRGRTAEAYLEAAHILTIPCAFIVDRSGKVAYIGHPLAIDDILAKIVAGTWDLADAATRYRLTREAEPLLDEFKSLLEAEKYDDAYALARKLVANQIRDDWRGLLIVANAIAGTESTVARRDLKLALDAALRANELTQYGDPGLICLLAQVHFRSGDVEKAIGLQTRAVALAEGGMKPVLQKLLVEYERALPPASSPR